MSVRLTCHQLKKKLKSQRKHFVSPRHSLHSQSLNIEISVSFVRSDFSHHKSSSDEEQQRGVKQKNEIAETSSSHVSAKGESSESFEKDWSEMQTLLENMKIEKNNTRNCLRRRTGTLRKKKEELETERR
ncbi:hypothetical protein Bca52824_000239 [Brassica carinata]|uniref:Uncharacterized protein n=1 Tax=Brassica carinata TaxID=52824 RepID=A0A8X7WFZ7_BRACI|nr:hypothetical protein Bca52824_000239 [Brassica carinata]